MSRASALARGQLAAQLGMVDACTIRRPSGSGTTDPLTGYPTQAYTALYAGKCRVQQHKAAADRQDIGEDSVMLLRIEVQLPMTVTGLKVGDEITMTASVYDADLPGRVFRIHDLAHKSEPTARRVHCVEVTGS